MLSVVYAAVLYAAVLRAGLLEVGNPYWVLSAGGVLLLSPIYHALLLPAIGSALRGDRADWRAALAGWPRLFPGLVLGELVVGVAVIAGSLLLLIPGIYLGMRLIYYKQAIVLEGVPAVGALRESVRRTAKGRVTVRLFLQLSVLYGCTFGLDLLLMQQAPPAVVHVGSVVGSALLLVWMNALVTASHAVQSGEADPTGGLATGRP